MIRLTVLFVIAMACIVAYVALAASGVPFWIYIWLLVPAIVIAFKLSLWASE